MNLRVDFLSIDSIEELPGCLDLELGILKILAMQPQLPDGLCASIGRCFFLFRY